MTKFKESLNSKIMRYTQNQTSASSLHIKTSRSRTRANFPLKWLQN